VTCSAGLDLTAPALLLQLNPFLLPFLFSAVQPVTLEGFSNAASSNVSSPSSVYASALSRAEREFRTLLGNCEGVSLYRRWLIMQSDPAAMGMYVSFHLKQTYAVILLTLLTGCSSRKILPMAIHLLLSLQNRDSVTVHLEDPSIISKLTPPPFSQPHILRCPAPSTHTAPFLPSYISTLYSHPPIRLCQISYRLPASSFPNSLSCALSLRPQPVCYDASRSRHSCFSFDIPWGTGLNGPAESAMAFLSLILGIFSTHLQMHMRTPCMCDYLSSSASQSLPITSHLHFLF
jgi:hypothetical protein